MLSNTSISQLSGEKGDGYTQRTGNMTTSNFQGLKEEHHLTSGFEESSCKLQNELRPRCNREMEGNMATKRHIRFSSNPSIHIIPHHEEYSIQEWQDIYMTTHHYRRIKQDLLSVLLAVGTVGTPTDSNVRKIQTSIHKRHITRGKRRRMLDMEDDVVSLQLDGINNHSLNDSNDEISLRGLERFIENHRVEQIGRVKLAIRAVLERQGAIGTSACYKKWLEINYKASCMKAAILARMTGMDDERAILSPSPTTQKMVR